MDHQSLIHLFEASVEKFSDNIFLWEKKQSEYRGITYKETSDRVRRLCAGFISIGVKKGDRVAIISEGRNDWVVSELAVLYCGAVSVPLSVRLEEPLDLAFRLRHSGCKGVIVSQYHKHKITALSEQLPDLEFIMLLDADEKPRQAETEGFSTWFIEDLVKKGIDYSQEHPRFFDDAQDSIQQSDYASICYSSGTSADPKGIILTHMNFLRNVMQGSLIFDVPSYYTTLHILPWDHSFTHTVGIYVLMRNGASLASLKTGKTLNETIRNIPVCIREVRPYFILSVPALTLNFKKNIEKGIRDKGIFTSMLFNAGLKVALAYNRDGYNRGTGSSRFLKPLYKIFDGAIFSKIRANFGGRLKFFVGGGALLDLELQRFFYALGLPIYQGYGLTEASPVISSNSPDFHKLGSSGKVVPMLDLKICDEQGLELPIGLKGEIVVKGENVMAGYWNNEAATTHSIRNGWLYTGDQGYLDEDGYLFVLGRTKSLLIGSDGEKYSPEGIEETMVARSAFFDQVVLHNDQSPYTIALIVMNKNAVLNYLNKMNLDPQTEKGQVAALKRLKQEIDQFMPHGEHSGMFPARWLPSAVAFIPEPFSDKNGLVNSTMKIVRHAVMNRYQPAVDSLYTPQGKDLFSDANKAAIAALKTDWQS